MDATLTRVHFPYNAIQDLQHINEVELTRMEYQHERLDVLVHGYTDNELRLRTNDVAIAELHGRYNTPITFPGYVVNVAEVPTTIRPAHKSLITLLGPTYVMKNGRQKIWKNLTISEIAQHICAEYQLTADIEPHTLRLSSVNQAGESDWSFLCRIARQFGYIVYGVGPVVHFHSRMRDTEQRYRIAPEFRYRLSQDLLATEIWEFNPHLSEIAMNPEGQKAQRAVQNVTDAGASFAAADSGAPAVATRAYAPQGSFAIYDSHITANTLAEAEARLKGAQERALWTHQATAETNGYAGTSPGSAVFLSGLMADYDGFWDVIGVTHTFNSRLRYRMNLTLGTNSLGTKLSGFTPGAMKPIDGLSSPAVRPTRSRPQLAGMAGDNAPAIIAARGGPPIVFWRGSVASEVTPPAEPTRPPYVTARLLRG